MPRPDASNADASAGRSQFHTTHWSVVLAAGQKASAQAANALETLCRTYWYPLYAYTRRRGYAPHDAEDLTQGFFARLLETNLLAQIEKDKGKFRSFLLTCFKHFLSDEQDRARRLKRGGGHDTISWDAEEAEHRYCQEPAHLLDPEKIYERRWALTVLEQALTRLKAELQDAGKSQLFDHLQAFVVGEKGAGRQAEIAAQLGLSAGNLGVTVHRLRRRYRQFLLESNRLEIREIGRGYRWRQRSSRCRWRHLPCPPQRNRRREPVAPLT
jgi:RNA polymerase sigma-70 factor (ECF subfamily)